MRENQDILGKWYLYRMRTSTEPLGVSLEIRRTFWGGLTCIFHSSHIRQGERRGRVSVGNGNVFCEFLSSRNKAPLTIVFFNHGSARVADYRLGTISGVLGESGNPYCAKMLLSRIELAGDKVKRVLNRYSCIYVPANVTELKSQYDS